MGLFNLFGAKKKDTLEELQAKQMECLERLDAVTDGNRRAQLQEELNEIETEIAEMNSAAGNQSTGMFRDTAENIDALKGARAPQTETTIKAEPPVATKSEEQLLDEALAMLATPNYEEGVKRITELAEQGYDWAQRKLAGMYWEGNRVPKDMAKAIFWYQKAAEQGNAEAQYCLGSRYQIGEGVEQNYEKAAYWYEKAAEQGNADAQCNLGYLYDSGNGVLMNYEKAASYYLAASNQGHVVGQFNLGLMYNNGLGVPRNIDKAIELYRAAAAQGFEPAKKELSRLDSLGLLGKNGQL